MTPMDVGGTLPQHYSNELNTGCIILDQCPIRVGDGTIIGAGSVVTKDIPEGVIAVGNPCKALRPITDEDRQFWQKQLDEFTSDTGITFD